MEFWHKELKKKMPDDAATSGVNLKRGAPKVNPQPMHVTVPRDGCQLSVEQIGIAYAKFENLKVELTAEDLIDLRHAVATQCQGIAPTQDMFAQARSYAKKLPRYNPWNEPNLCTWMFQNKAPTKVPLGKAEAAGGAARLSKTLIGDPKVMKKKAKWTCQTEAERQRAKWTCQTEEERQKWKRSRIEFYRILGEDPPAR